MASGEERLNSKGTDCDDWSTREQLCLASSVLKSGDRNWIKVSRGLKSFFQKESQRLPDGFSAKSCADQYAHLLKSIDTSERKEKEGSKTRCQSIVRRLTQERIKEISQNLAFQRDEYQQLKNELKQLETEEMSEEDLKKMCLQIELTEQEQEQKLNAHTAYLAKRQEQVLQTSQSLNLTINEKPESSEDHVISFHPSSSEKEDKRNEGGTSLLLTSVLEPQLTRTVSPQLHQLVPSPITHEAPPRLSDETPNTSMLLQLSAKLQSTTMPILEAHASSTNLPQQNVNLQMMQTENERENVEIMMPALTPEGISDSEIIDHIDKVIAEEKKTFLLDKDDFNELIWDIEELIKEEIADNPQVSEPRTAGVMESLISQPALITGKHDISIVPTKISVSDSPGSEIDIDQIDASSFDIAEIIGVAVENIATQEFKELESKSGEEEAETSLMSSEESRNEKAETGRGSGLVENSKVGIESRSAENKEKTTECTTMSDEENVERSSKGDSRNSTKQGPETSVKKDTQNSTIEDVGKLVKKDSKETLEDTKKFSKDDSKKKTKKNAKEDVLQVLQKSPLGKSKLTSENENSSGEKFVQATEKADRNEGVDQLELIHAKITGHQATLSTEVLSVSSNDPPSRKDTEKSQDISLILKHKEILPIQEKKKRKKGKKKKGKKLPSDSRVSSESSKEGVTIIKEDSGKDEKEETSVKAKEESKVVADLKKKNSKGDGRMDFLYIATNTLVTEDESIDVEVAVQEMGKESDPLKETEELPSEEGLSSNEEIKLELPKEEEFHEETSPDEGLKNEEMINLDDGVKKEESVISKSAGELDEEESTSSKLSRVKVRKTNSKKETIAVESELEMEGNKESADYRAWKKAVMLVYDRLVTHKYSSVFLKPITQEQAPGYHSIIYRPMDLTTIKKNIDNGTIRSTKHFQREVMLMCQNAIMYNKRNSLVYKMAVTMQEEFLEHMQILLQVTGEVSFRRETKTPASSSSESSECVVKKRRSYATPSPHAASGKKRPKSKKK